MSNTAIIRRLEREANAYAREQAAELAAFQRRERLSRMEVLVGDVLDWIVTRGDGAKLAALGITVSGGRDGIVFDRGGRRFEVVPRDDWSVMAGDTLVHPDRACPVLDRACYDEIMARVFRWARGGKGGVHRGR